MNNYTFEQELDRREPLPLNHTLIDSSTGDEYKINAFIGSGGSSLAYRAINEKTKFAVIIKETYPLSLSMCLERKMDGATETTSMTPIRDASELPNDCSDSGLILNPVVCIGNEQDLFYEKKIQAVNEQKLLEEIGVLENGNNSSTILKTYGCFYAGNTVYSIYDNANVKTFAEELDDTTLKLSLAEKLDLFLTVISSVAWLHGEEPVGIYSDRMPKNSKIKAPLLHLDLTPDNIMIGYDGNSVRCIPIDFNCSVKLNGRDSISGAEIKGYRPVYSDIDIKRASSGYTDVEISKSSDVFSLGCILFQMVMNRLPEHSDIYRNVNSFTDEIFAVNAKDFSESSDDKLRTVFDELNCLLKKSLHYAASSRHADTVEFYNDVYNVHTNIWSLTVSEPISSLDSDAVKEKKDAVRKAVEDKIKNQILGKLDDIDNAISNIVPEVKKYLSSEFLEVLKKTWDQSRQSEEKQKSNNIKPINIDIVAQKAFDAVFSSIDSQSEKSPLIKKLENKRFKSYFNKIVENSNIQFQQENYYALVPNENGEFEIIVPNDFLINAFYSDYYYETQTNTLVTDKTQLTVIDKCVEQIDDKLQLIKFSFNNIKFPKASVDENILFVGKSIMDDICFVHPGTYTSYIYDARPFPTVLWLQCKEFMILNPPLAKEHNNKNIIYEDSNASKQVVYDASEDSKIVYLEPSTLQPIYRHKKEGNTSISLENYYMFCPNFSSTSERISLTHFEVGKCYLYGLSTFPQSTIKAIENFELSETPEALYEIACILMHDEQLQDKEEAMIYLQKSAEAGCLIAKKEIFSDFVTESVENTRDVEICVIDINIGDKNTTLSHIRMKENGDIVGAEDSFPIVQNNANMSIAKKEFPAGFESQVDDYLANAFEREKKGDSESALKYYDKALRLIQSVFPVATEKDWKLDFIESTKEVDEDQLISDMQKEIDYLVTLDEVEDTINSAVICCANLSQIYMDEDINRAREYASIALHYLKAHNNLDVHNGILALLSKTYEKENRELETTKCTLLRVLNSVLVSLLEDNQTTAESYEEAVDLLVQKINHLSAMKNEKENANKDDFIDTKFQIDDYFLKAQECEENEDWDLASRYYDELLNIIESNFPGTLNDEWKIDFIESSEEVYLKKLTNQLQEDSQCLGMLDTEDENIDMVMESCSSLAIHLIMEKDILKAREYCAKALCYLKYCNNSKWHDTIFSILAKSYLEEERMIQVSKSLLLKTLSGLNFFEEDEQKEECLKEAEKIIDAVKTLLSQETNHNNKDTSVSEKTSELHRVILLKTGDLKMHIIKTLYDKLKYSLALSRDIAENTPIDIMVATSRNEAYELKASLEENGATVSVEPIKDEVTTAKEYYSKATEFQEAGNSNIALYWYEKAITVLEMVIPEYQVPTEKLSFVESKSKVDVPGTIVALTTEIEKKAFSTTQSDKVDLLIQCYLALATLYLENDPKLVHDFCVKSLFYLDYSNDLQYPYIVYTLLGQSYISADKYIEAERAMFIATAYDMINEKDKTKEKEKLEELMNIARRIIKHQS